MAETATSTTSAASAIFTTIAVVILVPAVLPDFYVALFGYVGLGALVALGLVLLTGVSGQTSFGQASFVGLAAYATTLLTRFAGAQPIVGLAAGLVLTGTIAWPNDVWPLTPVRSTRPSATSAPRPT